MKKHLIIASCISSVFLLSACGSTPQAKREVGSINFAYQPSETLESTNKTIALVSPTYKTNDIEKGNAGQANSLLAMAMQQRQAVNNQRMIQFQQFLPQYENRLISSMDASFNEIVINKGFKLSGPYQTFDDITYGDKKTSYLALTPDVDVYIDQKRVNFECVASKNYCEDIGTVQIGGSLTIKLIEPMTKQTFLSKRINLSEISKPRDYVKRTYYKGPQQGLLASAVGAAIDAATDDGVVKPLVDNTDKVLADALNEFYANAMQKVDTYLSREEILSFEEDVTKVKNLKRF